MSGEARERRSEQRFASVTKLLPGHRDEYVRLHAAVWPEVRQIIRDHGIVNHSIFYLDGLLFRYYEYRGLDHAVDLRRLSEHPGMANWVSVTDACQENVLGPRQDKWTPAEEICHFG